VVGETVAMAFGQQSGPPATAKEVQELLRLVQEAGHDDFRDARGPMGFTQRQVGGKFSRNEVAAFIEQLQTAADADANAAAPIPAKEVVKRSSAAKAPAKAAAKSAAAAQPLSAMDQTLRRFPTEKLAAELQRRGWVVLEP
jgi:hypothetical protein